MRARKGARAAAACGGGRRARAAAGLSAARTPTPYHPLPWHRSEVTIYVEVPPGVRAKQLDVAIQPHHLRVAILGNPPYLDVRC